MAGTDLTVAADTRSCCGDLIPEMRRSLAARGGALVAQPTAKSHSSPEEDACSSPAGNILPVTVSPKGSFMAQKWRPGGPFRVA
jgi:hypothetical protein